MAIEYPSDDELSTHYLSLFMLKSWSTTTEVISGNEKLTLHYLRDHIISEEVRQLKKRTEMNFM